MHKGAVAWVIVFIIIAVLAIVYTGTKFLSPLKKTTVIPITTSTATTSVNTTSIASTTINYSNSELPCSKFYMIGQEYNTNYTAKCLSNGSTYGVWVAAGNGGSERVIITGANGRVYVNQSSSYNCTTFFQNFTGPAQLYTITFLTGPGGGSCGNPEVIVNSTSVPPRTIYDYIYNGNFGNGEYTGWNATGAGFGTKPLNITYADSNAMCYNGQPWSNYNGTYFATTYNCGITVAPGNLTSEAFIVNPSKPFLNFRIISPQNNELYVELLRQNYANVAGRQLYINTTPVLVAHINTYNQSVSINSSSTFEDVSIPLTPYINQILQIRVVAVKEAQSNEYIAVGDFVLANRPKQTAGIIVNITTPSN